MTPAKIYWEDLQRGTVHALGSVTTSAEAMIAFAQEFDPQPFHLDEEAGEASRKMPSRVCREIRSVVFSVISRYSRLARAASRSPRRLAVASRQLVPRATTSTAGDSATAMTNTRGRDCGTKRAASRTTAPAR